MGAAVCHSSGLIVAVILPCQRPAWVAALAPLPVSAMTLAIVILYLSDVVGIVVAQHSIALPGFATDKSGIPPPTQAAGNSADHFPVRTGYLAGIIRFSIHIHAFSAYCSIPEFSIEGSAFLKIQHTEAAGFPIFHHTNVDHFCPVIMGCAAGF